jgi:perosamine synthetase
MAMAHTMALPSDADHTGRDVGHDELALLREVIDSGTLNCTKGSQVQEFERAFAVRYGVRHARAVSSGTAACHSAIAAVDPEPGDEIITTSITDMGAIAPILYQLAIPVFADVDPMSLNVTPETVAARITSRTRAIIATHLFGNPCDVIGITRVAAAHGIPVIEDCAADLLDLAEDDVDPRMGRHPGMREPLARKRARLRDTLRTIAAARRVTTYRAAVETGTWQ